MMIRKFLLIILLSKLTYGFSQDTLRQQNTFGYSKYFVIHEKNQFELFFHHCTGTTYGKGEVKKGLVRWKFIFDEHPIQESFVVKDTSKISDSIVIKLFEFPDTTVYEPMFFGVNKEKLTYFQGITFPKSKFNTDSLSIYVDEDLFIVKDASRLSSVDIYLFTGWLTYFDCEKMILHKRNKVFFERSFTFEENEEKPWKKTKRRIKEYYEF